MDISSIYIMTAKWLFLLEKWIASPGMYITELDGKWWPCPQFYFRLSHFPFHPDAVCIIKIVSIFYLSIFYNNASIRINKITIPLIYPE